MSEEVESPGEEVESPQSIQDGEEVESPQPVHDGGGGQEGLFATPFENEWASFLYGLQQDETTKNLGDYLKRVHLTTRTKEKLLVYITTVLQREFCVSNISSEFDYRQVILDKEVVDSEFYLGLTRFDITPELQHIFNLIDIKFKIKIRRSKGGFERRMISTMRQEMVSEEKKRGEEEEKRKAGMTDRLRKSFGGD